MICFSYSVRAAVILSVVSFLCLSNELKKKANRISGDRGRPPVFSTNELKDGKTGFAFFPSLRSLSPSFFDEEIHSCSV